MAKSDEKEAKVAIISFVTNSSHLNYGATLHGFALQTYLRKKFNLESDIIDYFPKALEGENLKFPILNKRGSRSSVNNLLVKLNWLIGFRANIRKWRKFQKFNNENLKTTGKYDYLSLQHASKNELPYHVFVCEADVIWKIFDSHSFDENFFLAFDAAKDAIKVAYAPTVASKPLEGNFLTKFKQLTSDFYAISARESKGAEYLRSILDRNVEHCLDPTLLLDEEDYNTITVTPKEAEEYKEYLLIYTCTVNDREMVKAATNYGRQNGLKVIEISNYSLNRFVINHTVKTDIGIEEWLGYFKHAKLICTNSFHGMCFSILFKKNFLVFERDKRDYRMPDMANVLGIENRLITCDSRAIPANPRNVDYDEVYKRLAILREQSNNFIRNSIVDIIKQAP